VKILFVSYFAPPIASAESIQVAKTLRGLAGLGCEITLITSAGSKLYPSDPQLDGLMPPSVRVVRVPSRESRSLHLSAHVFVPFLLYLPDPMRWWARNATTVVRELAAREEFDLLVTRAQPFSCHLVGLRLARRLQMPWLAHFSDPLADNPYYYRFWANPHRQPNARLEASIVAAADEVHVVSDEIARCFRSRHGADARVRVMPHCYDAALYSGRPAEAIQAGGSLRIVHAGTFTGTRNPANFLRALKIVLTARPEYRNLLRVRFCGPVAPRYRRLAATLGLDGNVEFVGRVDYLTSLAEMSAADWLLLIDTGFDGESMFFPSKLVDYLGAGRPILALTPAAGASARILRDAGCHRTVDPDNVPDIAEYLLALLQSEAPLPLAPQLASNVVSQELFQRCTELARNSIVLEAQSR
jgi:glycosyltransferase involved in cell wall biosynthesis